MDQQEKKMGSEEILEMIKNSSKHKEQGSSENIYQINVFDQGSDSDCSFHSFKNLLCAHDLVNAIHQENSSEEKIEETVKKALSNFMEKDPNNYFSKPKEIIYSKINTEQRKVIKETDEDEIQKIIEKIQEDSCINIDSINMLLNEYNEYNILQNLPQTNGEICDLSYYTKQINDGLASIKNNSKNFFGFLFQYMESDPKHAMSLCFTKIGDKKIMFLFDPYKKNTPILNRNFLLINKLKELFFDKDENHLLKNATQKVFDYLCKTFERFETLYSDFSSYDENTDEQKIIHTLLNYAGTKNKNPDNVFFVKKSDIYSLIKAIENEKDYAILKNIFNKVLQENLQKTQNLLKNMQILDDIKTSKNENNKFIKKIKYDNSDIATNEGYIYHDVFVIKNYIKEYLNNTSGIISRLKEALIKHKIKLHLMIKNLVQKFGTKKND
jgi:hypothetical protein